MSGHEEHRGFRPRVLFDALATIGPLSSMYVSPRLITGNSTTTSLFWIKVGQGHGDDTSASALQVASGQATAATGTRCSKFVCEHDIKESAAPRAPRITIAS